MCALFWFAYTRHDPSWKPEPSPPIDYCYVRPHHIPAVNALCGEYFWSGIDSECQHLMGTSNTHLIYSVNGRCYVIVCWPYRSCSCSLAWAVDGHVMHSSALACASHLRLLRLCCLVLIITSVCQVVWSHINEVTLHRARLVRRWTTVCGWAVMSCNQQVRPTQSPTLSGMENDYRPWSSGSAVQLGS